MVFGREIAKDLIEGADVIGAVVGRQSDAGKQHPDACIQESGKYVVEVVPRLIEREAAEPIVSAKLDDDDRGVKSNDLGQVCDRIFGCGAAGSHIDDFVSVAVRAQLSLQLVREGLPRLNTVAGGDAVAKTDEERWVRCPKRTAQQEEAK